MAKRTDQSQPAAKAGAAPKGELLDLTIVDVSGPMCSGRLTQTQLEWISRQVQASARIMGGPSGDTQPGQASPVRGTLAVRVVDDQEMATAHKEFCDIEGTTDVLTFDLIDGQAAQTRVIEADILICFDQAMRQAKPRGHAVEKEILLYIVHGMLHCLGYDDHDESAYDAMHSTEDRIFAELGIGPIFQASGIDPSTNVESVFVPPTTPSQGGER